MTAEEFRRYADRCLEWAAHADHEDIRSVYFTMANEWTRQADEADAKAMRESLQATRPFRAHAA